MILEKKCFHLIRFMPGASAHVSFNVCTWIQYIVSSNKKLHCGNIVFMNSNFFLLKTPSIKQEKHNARGPPLLLLESKEQPRKQSSRH